MRSSATGRRFHSSSTADLASCRRLTTRSRLLRHSSSSSLSSSKSLLSGASRGFGLAIALSLGKAGCKSHASWTPESSTENEQYVLRLDPC
ncbi:uncharacterized protein G2W53_018765 [Senna tora]|uniref:Uncharacterized protein n=1 Tax=Senna tora TaxID=362788 RepID=A0A834WQ45_9FABA|nr:uncharacterized protein G2W53_018765 [Senna tora]